LQERISLDEALDHFIKSTEKDNSERNQAAYRSQFAKAYYNIGMIQDK